MTSDFINREQEIIFKNHTILILPLILILTFILIPN